jgi:hypothetical protein
MDPRVTMDRHGPIHLGEGQAVALIGDDLGGVRWRTSAKLLGAFDELKREMFAANARADDAVVRKVLLKAIVQALRDGRVLP